MLRGYSECVIPAQSQSGDRLGGFVIAHGVHEGDSVRSKATFECENVIVGEPAVVGI